MSWASGKIQLAPDNLSLRKAQKLTPSFRHVFFRLAKVSRRRRPRSLRVEPLTRRFFTYSRMSVSLVLLCKGMSGLSITSKSSGLFSRILASAWLSLA